MVTENVEDQIRDSKMRQDYYKLVEMDIHELVEPELKTFVNVNCPNCNEKKGTYKYKKGVFDFLQCGTCGTLYINPRPQKALLDKYYQNAKAIEAFSDILIESEEKRLKLFFEPRAQQINDYLNENNVNSGKLLEVGCSIGTMLSLFKKTQFQLFGIDPDLKASKVAEDKYGITMSKVTLEDYDNSSGDRYDVVMNFETIEHVYSPFSFLSKINSIMRTNGHLIFTTPNYFGFDIKILDAKYKNIYGPNHLNYFNVRTIDYLLDRTGFKVTKKLTPGILDVAVLKNQIASGDSGEVDPFLYFLLFECPKETTDEFQLFIQRNLLSSNMMIFAQKTKEL